VNLGLALSAVERRQVEEMAQHAGRLSEIPLPNGRVLVVDDSPNGENLLYLSPNAAAGTLVDPGWFLWAELSDDWSGSTTVNRAQASLKRIGGPNEVRGSTKAVTEFLANDYAVADAKTQLPLPVGAVNARKASTGLPPTVRYVPVGDNLLTNPGGETVSPVGWTPYAGGDSVVSTATTAKLGGSSLLTTEANGFGWVASQEISVTPGVYYAIAAWAKRGTAARAWISIYFYSATGGLVEHATHAATSTTEWSYLRTGGLAPPDAVTARIFLKSDLGTAYFDGVTCQPCVPLVESPYPEPSAAGGTEGGSVQYDVAPAAHFAGDVKVYDMGAQTSATLPASSYTRAYSPRHAFTGELLLDNGIVRIHLNRRDATTGGFFFAFAYVDGVWTSTRMYVDTGGGLGGTLRTVRVTKLSRAEVRAHVTDTMGNVFVLALARGAPGFTLTTVRVADGGANQQRLLTGTSRLLVINGSTVVGDTGPAPNVAVSTAGAALTEPYALAATPTTPFFILTVLPRKPTTIGHGDGYCVPTYSAAPTTAYERTFFVFLLPFPWITTSSYLVEAESASTPLGPAQADATASGGSVIRATTSGQGVKHARVAGRDYPLGDYTLIVRAKDTAGVAGDLSLAVYNATDAAYIAGPSGKTLSGAYAYYTLDFSLTAAHDADTIELHALKATGAANTLDIDYLLVVPRQRNASTPLHVHFPRDLARNALMTTNQRDTVQAE
jgi:hypothetical protein